MSHHIIRSADYDWIALYRDDECLHQGHSIQEEDMLRLLGIEFTHQVASADQFNEWGGQAPEILGSPMDRVVESIPEQRT